MESKEELIAKYEGKKWETPVWYHKRENCVYEQYQFEQLRDEGYFGKRMMGKPFVASHIQHTETSVGYSYMERCYVVRTKHTGMTEIATGRFFAEGQALWE